MYLAYIVFDVEWCYVYFGDGLMLCPLADVVANLYKP